MMTIEYRIGNYDKVFKKFFWTKKGAEKFIAAKHSKCSDMTCKDIAPRKVIAGILIILGLVVLVGTAGGSDMNLEMSITQILKQMVVGINLIILGILIK